MTTKIKIWEISEGKLLPKDNSNFADSHREDELENWVAGGSDILGEKLLIVACQLAIPGVGRLDLLAIDAAGRFVIVELKRAMAPREAIAQALDYASWLS